MSNRLGLIDPASMDGKQKEAYGIMDSYTSVKYGKSFVTKLSDGRLVGPFGVQMHIPEIAEHFVGFAKALANVPGLSIRAREVAINVIGAHTKAAYEHVAHNKLAQGIGFSEEQLEEIQRGFCPTSLSEEEKISFEVANELLENAGPMRQDVWDQAVTVLGKSGAMVLVQYVGFYRYIATILNGFDVKVPQSELR